MYRQITQRLDAMGGCFHKYGLSVVTVQVDIPNISSRYMKVVVNLIC